jgi:hypothetical protein
VGMVGSWIHTKAPTGGLRLGFALHVPASSTGRLVGRPGSAYHWAPKVGTKDNMSLGVNLLYTANHSLDRVYSPLYCGSRTLLFYLHVLVKGRGEMSS